MLSTYDKKEYIRQWNSGIHNDITLKAKTSSGRDWRRFICKYLVDDFLEIASGREEDETLLSLSPVLTWLDHGMAYTARLYIGKVESLTGWYLTDWFVDSLKNIEDTSDYVEDNPDPDHI